MSQSSLKLFRKTKASVSLKLSNMSKFIKIVLIFCVTFTSSLAKSFNSALSIAVKNVTKPLITANRVISVSNFGSDFDLIDSVFLKSFGQENFPYNISHSKIIRNNNYFMYGPGLLIFDSVDTLKAFNIVINVRNSLPKSMHFVVYCKKATFRDIESAKIVFSIKRKYQQFVTDLVDMTNIMQFQYFIVNDGDFIKLLTFVFYMPGYCGEAKLVEVNRFDKNKGLWETDNFKLDKFANFNGCPLVIGVFKYSFASHFEIDENGMIVYGGYQVEALRAMAENLNFTCHLTPYLHLEKKFYFKDIKLDYLLAAGSLGQYKYLHKVHITRPYLFTSDVIVVPIGEEFSAYEKLILPFDFVTWALIIFSFVAAFTTILVLRCFGSDVRHFVFGRNVNSPALNVIMILFGISQIVLPRRNFARYLTTLYILYCLIIRTAWQGKTFEFMQKDMRKPEVQSIAEMIDRNYTFYVRTNFLEFYDNVDIAIR